MTAVAASDAESWPTVPLARVAELVRGVSYPKADAREEPRAGYVPVLRATNIQDSRLVLDSDLVYVAERNISPDQLLRTDDIVVATSSGSKHLVGKSAQLHSPWHGAFGAFCAAIRPRQEINSRFLALFLRSPGYWRQVTKKALGVNINNLRRGDLEALDVPLPPLSVQRRIVAEIEKQFSRLDEAASTIRAARMRLTNYKASVLTAVQTGALCGLDFEGWPNRSLGEVATMVQYGSSAKTSATVKGVPVLRMGNIEGGELLVDDLKFLPADHDEFPGLLLQVGDLLFNRTNSPELVGKTAVYKGNPRPCSFASYLIRVRFIEDVLPEFVAFVLNSSLGRAWVKSVVSQQVGQANVNGTKLKRFQLRLPPVAAQRKLVAEAERHLSLIRNTEVQLGAAELRSGYFRSSALARAFGANGDRSESCASRD